MSDRRVVPGGSLLGLRFPTVNGIIRSVAGEPAEVTYHPFPDSARRVPRRRVLVPPIRGRYNPFTNTLRINLDSTEGDSRALAAAVVHETTHFFQDKKNRMLFGMKGRLPADLRRRARLAVAGRNYPWLVRGFERLAFAAEITQFGVVR